MSIRPDADVCDLGPGCGRGQAAARKRVFDGVVLSIGNLADGARHPAPTARAWPAMFAVNEKLWPNGGEGGHDCLLKLTDYTRLGETSECV
jgi:hypothetical protein